MLNIIDGIKLLVCLDLFYEAILQLRCAYRYSLHVFFCVCVWGSWTSLRNTLLISAGERNDKFCENRVGNNVTWLSSCHRRR